MKENFEIISVEEKPEERARKKIDAQLRSAGWDIVSRNEYVPDSAAAVKEAIMQGGKESDYLLFVDNKAWKEHYLNAWTKKDDSRYDVLIG